MDKNFIGRLNALISDITDSIKELARDNGGKVELPDYSDPDNWDEDVYVDIVTDEFGSVEKYSVESVGEDGTLLCKDASGLEHETTIECLTVEDLQYLYYCIEEILKPSPVK